MTTGNWLIVHNTSGREELTALALRQHGYAETFYPYDEVENPKYFQWKKRKVSFLRAGRKPPRKPPRWIRGTVVKGYTFVSIGGGDRMRLVNVCRAISDRHEKLFLRVVAPGGVPYAVTDDVMKQMRKVPERLKEMIEEAVRLEAEMAAARMPVVGGKALVLEGAFAGEAFEVEHIADGWVTFPTPWGKMKAMVAHVERVG